MDEHVYEGGEADLWKDCKREIGAGDALLHSMLSLNGSRISFHGVRQPSAGSLYIRSFSWLIISW